MSNDFNIDKGALDLLMTVTQGLKKSTTGEAEGKTKVIGLKNEPGVGNIFGAFRSFIHESPLKRFRRIVKDKVMKKKRSPILQLIDVINQMFSKGASKKTVNAEKKVVRRKFKRRTRQRGGTKLVL